MGLFDRNDYGRDYGRDYRGGRSPGDRVRGAWNRFGQGMEGGMHPGGYDRDVRSGAGRGTGGGWGGQGQQGGGYDASDFAYRGLDGAWSTAFNRGAHDTQWDWRAAGGSRYDQDMAPHHGRGQPSGGGGYGGRGGMGYGRDYGARGGYDRDVHGGRDRMRTDAGDPFGDRQGRTPFRVIRGGFDTGQTDRGSWMRGDGFDRLGRDPNGVEGRGWGHGIGDDPVYRPEDFEGRDRGRGRRGPY
jgi:hypothetical protein